MFCSGVSGLNGQKVLAYSEPLPLAFANWAIIAEQDWAELMAPAAEKRNMLLLASLICAGGMSIFGWLFARSVTQTDRPDLRRHGGGVLRRAGH